MSTSGVPRPSPLGRIAKKTTPAAGVAPEDTETEVEETPTDKAPARPGTARAGKGTGGRTPAVKTGSARNGAAATTTPGAKVTPAKAAKITPKVIDVDVDDGDEDDALDSDDVVTPARKSPAKPVTRTPVTRTPVTRTPVTRTPVTRTPVKTAARPGDKGPAGRGPVRGASGGKGRKPSGRPIRVYQARNWAQIGLFVTAAVVALAIVGFGIYALVSRPDPTKWQQRADAIPGIVDYRNRTRPGSSQRNHVQGVLQYMTNPPVGGNHNPIWQNCMGDVYTAADRQGARDAQPRARRGLGRLPARPAEGPGGQAGQQGRRQVHSR